MSGSGAPATSPHLINDHPRLAIPGSAKRQPGIPLGSGRFARAWIPDRGLSTTKV